MNYIPEELYKVLASEGDEIDRILNGYIAYLKKSKQGASEPGANHHVHEVSLSQVAESGGAFTEPEDTVL